MDVFSDMPDERALETDYEFLGFGGIHDSVMLYTTRMIFIDDVSVSTWNEGATGLYNSIPLSTLAQKIIYILQTLGHLNYSVKTIGASGRTSDLQSLKVRVELEDKMKNVVAQASGPSGQLRIPQVKLWWPVGMVPDDQVGYLYKLKITLLDPSSDIPQDSYSLNVGIRTVTWSQNEFFINGKPFYFKGCGRYEYEDVSARISFHWPKA